MSAAPQVAPKYKTGDWVTLQYGPRWVWGTVVEDRGRLGANRRRLYRVRVEPEAGEPMAFEVPEDDLSLAVPDKDDVIRYLKEGGLAAILRTNLGGKHPPRIWLTLDAHGRVRHTFSADRGMIGGETAPFWSLHDDKIFRPKRDEVVRFLNSFGLDRSEAGGVVEAVGLSSP